MAILSEDIITKPSQPDLNAGIDELVERVYRDPVFVHTGEKAFDLRQLLKGALHSYDQAMRHAPDSARPYIARAVRDALTIAMMRAYNNQLKKETLDSKFYHLVMAYDRLNNIGYLHSKMSGNS